MSLQRVSDLLLVTILCLFSSALLPLSAAEQVDREVSKGTPTASNAPQDPSLPVKHCTIVDSNGPLEGGEVKTYGCSENEFCDCEYSAGYSCGGRCRPLDKEREAIQLVLPVMAYAKDLPTPPPEPDVKPVISSDYELDADGNRIEDELDARLKHATAEALLLPIEMELIFNKQITQEQIQAFADLGGEFKTVFRAVSYGWIGTLPLEQVAELVQAMGDSLVYVGLPKEAQLTNGGGDDAVERGDIEDSLGDGGS